MTNSWQKNMLNVFKYNPYMGKKKNYCGEEVTCSSEKALKFKIKRC